MTIMEQFNEIEKATEKLQNLLDSDPMDFLGRSDYEYDQEKGRKAVDGIKRK